MISGLGVTVRVEMKILPRGPELPQLRLGEAEVIEALALAMTLIAVIAGIPYTALLGAAVTIAIVLILQFGRSHQSR